MRLSGVPVSQNFFPLLGVQPQLGRLFNDDECKWHGPKAVLLSHGLWERRFASDPKIVGRPLTINDEPVNVVGVMPESFDFASVFAPGSHIDLYFPFPLTQETNRWGNTLAMIGRLKPGVSRAERAGRSHGARRPAHRAPIRSATTLKATSRRSPSTSADASARRWPCSPSPSAWSC